MYNLRKNNLKIFITLILQQNCQIIMLLLFINKFLLSASSLMIFSEQNNKFFKLNLLDKN